MRMEYLPLQAITAGGALLLAVALPGSAYAQSNNMAVGFSALPQNARVVIMPTDIELKVMDLDGPKPRADWIEAASRNFKATLIEKLRSLRVVTVELSGKDADEVAEVNKLHEVVAYAISFHHFGNRQNRLGTKGGKLDWSLGDSVSVIKQKTGSDYALFSRVRNVYLGEGCVGANIASVAVGTIATIATLGLARPHVVCRNNIQELNYVSLVDLNSGQVLWINPQYDAGDLREPEKAVKTLNVLLDKFPGPK